MGAKNIVSKQSVLISLLAQCSIRYIPPRVKCSEENLGALNWIEVRKRKYRSAYMQIKKRIHFKKD